MSRIVRLLSIFLVLLAGSAAWPAAAQDGNRSAVSGHGLQYDGLYQGERKTFGTADYWQYLRFFPDGTVIEGGSTGRPEDVIKWFDKGHPNVSTGKVTIRGRHLSFTTATKAGTADYTGKFGRDKMDLRMHSNIDQHRASNRFVFVPIKY